MSTTSSAYDADGRGEHSSPAKCGLVVIVERFDSLFEHEHQVGTEQQEVDGALQVNSKPGAGTEIVLKVPI